MTGAVPRETVALLGRFEELVRAGSARQNLVSATTLETFRHRHIDDALQLLPLIGGGRLVDVGSGAGLPGIVLAICRNDPTDLVEPRRLRAAFLNETIAELGLTDRATVHATRIETIMLAGIATITARAVAPIETLFAITGHLAGPDTRWVLPKGRTAAAELERARAAWHGEFRLVPSATDPEAAIVVAERVRRRTR